MIRITLKSGDIKEIEAPMRIYEIAKSISEGLARVATAAQLDGKTVDLRTVVNKDAALNILTFEQPEGRLAYRHTASHILAQAVKRLYPSVKLAIGPAIENGFYYDFDSERAFTPEDLEALEKEMIKITKENLPIEKFELSRAEAIEHMKQQGEDYKVELIQDLPEDAVISFYRQGEFTDLCAGPHLMTTGGVKAMKLQNVAGAYWRGNEKNKMLQRIYGTAFPKKADLTAYLEQVEEAKKRDHNKLGRELGLFTTNELVGQGLPLLMPKGAKIIQILQRFVEDEEERRGYLMTKTPFMAKKELYQVSGHWDHYKEGMFVLGDEEKDDEIFALRPMTCPFQYQVYNAEMHSYRDLPVRFNETSTLFRNEASGEMHGLIRVRQFTLSEGHLIVTPEQLAEEFKGVVDLIKFMMRTLGIENDVTYRFSKWDENDRDKYIGTKEQWEDTQNKMREILNELRLDFTEEDGEAAFYGPKLDIQFKNVHGKEDTIITVQIDFCLAEKFNMTYVDKDNEKKTPYIIHRSSIGCYERTLAMLIEKYAGAFPVWLAPVQVEMIPISDKHTDFAYTVKEKLEKMGIRVHVDTRAEKMGYKIREAQLNKIPYMLVMGDKEMENGEVSVRRRGEGDIGAMKVEAFVDLIAEDVATKAIW